MMDIHPPTPHSLHTLLRKEMDRREFLIYVGTLFLVVTGVAGLMKALHEPISHLEPAQASGFGHGAYGGKGGTA